jgi:hypothetical protein
MMSFSKKTLYSESEFDVESNYKYTLTPSANSTVPVRTEFLYELEPV